MQYASYFSSFQRLFGKLSTPTILERTEKMSNNLIRLVSVSRLRPAS